MNLFQRIPAKLLFAVAWTLSLAVGLAEWFEYKFIPSASTGDQIGNLPWSFAITIALGYLAWSGRRWAKVVLSLLVFLGLSLHLYFGVPTTAYYLVQAILQVASFRLLLSPGFSRHG